MNIGIIRSGGSGSRLGAKIPKQYIKIGNKPIIQYSIEKFLRNKLIDAIIIVCTEQWQPLLTEIKLSINTKKTISFANAGETRQLSILEGLKMAAELYGTSDNIVLIHDGARPLVSDDLISRCILNCGEYDCVMPVVGVKDTIYLSSDGSHIDSLLNRKELWCGQAPESFVMDKYLNSHKKVGYENLKSINGSTELAHLTGLKCKMIKGDPINFKITTAEDLINFKNIINNSDASL